MGARLKALIEPNYPKRGKVGRLPVGVPRMLRMYFLQQWYTLADEALEDTLYDSQAMREFVGIDLAREQVPDATTPRRRPNQRRGPGVESGFFRTDHMRAGG